MQQVKQDIVNWSINVSLGSNLESDPPRVQERAGSKLCTVHVAYKGDSMFRNAIPSSMLRMLACDREVGKDASLGNVIERCGTFIGGWQSILHEHVDRVTGRCGRPLQKGLQSRLGEQNSYTISYLGILMGRRDSVLVVGSVVQVFVYGDGVLTICRTHRIVRAKCTDVRVGYMKGAGSE
jgi:hypothetical protein